LDLESSTLILCPPGPAYFGVSDLNFHNIIQASDQDEALKQHQALVQSIQAAGHEVISIPELPGHPNSVFTKDTAVCTPEGYIKLRMGLPSRAGEEHWIAEVLDEMGIPCCGAVEPPGTVEGGDIILAGTIAFAGHSSRTNREGIRQISMILESMNIEVRIHSVPPPFLHIGGTMTLVNPETILYVSNLFPDQFFDGFLRIEVPHSGFISGNVIPLDNNQVIGDQGNQPACNALKSHGFTVYTLNLSEFIKGTGGPSCLVLQVC